jgi:hypothetical protein
MTRKIVNRSPHREVGVINAGWLLNHAVHHESHLERRFVMSALACPVVENIIHQPITIHLPGDQVRKYTPDYQLYYQGGGSCFIEVKPHIFVQKHEETLAKAKTVFAEMGEKFMVVTDRQIDKNDLGNRSILLMRYARMSFDAIEATACFDVIQAMNKKELRVRDLILHGISEPVIWNLVAKHQLKVPAGFDLSEDTPIAINTQEENCHDLLCAWFAIEAR